MLALASDECLGLTRCGFLARVRSVAWIHTGMVADCLLPPACLFAVGISILALSCAMAHLLTEMIAAAKLLVTWQSASDFGKPTRLIFQCLLPTDARLLDKEWALRALFCVFVTLMLDLTMTTSALASAVEAALRWLGATRLRRLKNSSAACTADIFKHSFQTCSARPLVAE